MKCRVLCHSEIARTLSTKFSSESIDIVDYSEQSESSILEKVADCQILISSLATKKTIESGNNLKFIQSFGVGVDRIDLPFAHQKGIIVSNLAKFNSSTVANYTLSAILLLTTRLHAFDNVIKQQTNTLRKKAINRLFGNKKAGFFINPPFEIQELNGKVLSIVGFGAIGQAIAQRASAFDMRILAIKRHPLMSKPLGVDFMGTLKDLHTLLENADFLSLNIPLTRETNGIIGAKQIQMMKPSAYLINTSRPEILDHKALYSALKNGSLAGAVLDVVDESFKKSFAKLDNVVLTPHISGESKESFARGIEETAININRVISGQIPLNVVLPGELY